MGLGSSIRTRLVWSKGSSEADGLTAVLWEAPGPVGAGGGGTYDDTQQQDETLWYPNVLTYNFTGAEAASGDGTLDVQWLGADGQVLETADWQDRNRKAFLLYFAGDATQELDGLRGALAEADAGVEDQPRPRHAFILEEREPLYERAELALDTSGQSVTEVSQQLLQLID